MLLQFASYEIFATGSSRYEYQPASKEDISNRILISIAVEIDQVVFTQAILDTGSPYAVLSPKVAKLAGFSNQMILERSSLRVRGYLHQGSVARLNITLPATSGSSLTVDATAFIPDEADIWGDFPSFLGLSGFLERIRFAIDPNTDTFYFGSL